MVKGIVYLLFGIAWLAVESAFISFIPLGIPTPDVVLILVVAFAFRLPLARSGVLSFLLGLFQDVLVGAALGSNALSKTVVCALSRGIAERFYLSNVVSEVLMVIVGGVVDALLVTSILLVGGQALPALARIEQIVLLQLAATVLFAPVVVLALRWLAERLEPAADVYEDEVY